MSISGTPDIFDHGDLTPVIVARNTDNRLLTWAIGNDGWVVTDLTGPFGFFITGNPHGYRFTVLDNEGYHHTEHVVARSPDNRLLEWWRSLRDATWRVVSLTDYAEKVGPGVGEALIAGDPHGNSLPYSVEGESQNIVYVVARSPDNRLLEWSRYRATWQVVNDFPSL